MHSDGTYEDAYAWYGYGCQAPDFGSFAERFEGHGQISAVVLDLTATQSWYPFADVYLWGDESGAPGPVLVLMTEVFIGGIAYWPQVSRHIIDLPEPTCVEGVWWVGFWGIWPLQSEPEFFVGADLDGPGGGSPMTKIAPGLEWPEGWQPVEVRWGPTAALGIGAEVDEAPSPPISATWGAIKNLYR